MKKLLFASLACSFFFFAGCEKTIQQEEQDVREAQQDAAENVAEEQQDVRRAAEEGAADVNEEKREADEARREADPNTP